ncbi:MAG: phage tail tape measure protein [Neomegalonema sp.]
MTDARKLQTASVAVSTLRSELSALNRDLKASSKASQELVSDIGSSFETALSQLVLKGGKLSGVFRNLVSSVAGKALEQAVSPLKTALSTSAAGLFNQVGGAVLGGVLGFSSGGAFAGGRAMTGVSGLGANVRAFSRGGAFGGVVGAPTLFPMRRGVGLMGEAGPEAVLPLSRGPDGRLGVQASSQGGSSGLQPWHSGVSVHIHTPDVQGFHRSQSQVAAQLARAVDRGRRRL